MDVQEGWGASIGTVGAGPPRPRVEVTCGSRSWSQARHWPVGTEGVTGNLCSQMSAAVTSQALACLSEAKQ